MTPTPARTPDADGRSTDESVRQTVARLRSYQKPNRGAPAYSRFVNRPVGRVLAAVAFHAGLTPNRVTAISATFSLAGIALLALLPATWWLGLVVALLLALGYAFDSADGQLARLQGSGRPSGEWLDHVVDCAKITALHLAVLVGIHRHFGDSPANLVPMGFLLVANLLFFTFILTDQLKRAHGHTGAAVSDPASTWRSLAVVPTDYGLLCIVFVLWGAPSAFLTVYALMLAGSLGYLLLGAPKWFKDVDRAAGVRS